MDNNNKASIFTCIAILLIFAKAADKFADIYNSNDIMRFFTDKTIEYGEETVENKIDEVYDTLYKDDKTTGEAEKNKLIQKITEFLNNIKGLQDDFYQFVVGTNEISPDTSGLLDRKIKSLNYGTQIDITQLEKAIDSIEELTEKQKSDLAAFCKPLLEGIDYNGKHINGLGITQVAAIAGNAWRECNFNPADHTITGINEYHGMINLSNERFAGLQKYVDEKNKTNNTKVDWTDPKTQGEYVLVELFGDSVEYWAGGEGDRKAFLDSNDVQEATTIFFVSTKMGIVFRGQGIAEIKGIYPTWDVNTGWDMAEKVNNALQQIIVIKSQSDSTEPVQFKTYKFTDKQLQGIANVCVREQGNGNYAGIVAEASLMANLFELSYNGTYNKKIEAEGFYEFIRFCDWFGSVKYDTPGVMDTGISKEGENVKATEKEVELVRMVLEEGYRTLPLSVIEHVSLNSIDYILVDGEKRDKNDKSNYISFITEIYQAMRRTLDIYFVP